MDATEVWRTDSDAGAAAPRRAVRHDAVNAVPHHARGRYSGIWLVLVAMAVLVASASLLGLIGGVPWAGIIAAMILIAVGFAGFTGGGRWAAATVAIMLLPVLLYWLAARSSRVDVEASASLVGESTTHPAPVPVRDLEAFDVHADAGADDDEPESEIRLTPQTVRPGGEVTLSVMVPVPKGSYTYSNNPKVPGATRFDVQQTTGLVPLGEGFQASHAPKVEFSPELDTTVEKHLRDVTWTRKYRVAPDAFGRVQLAGTLRYQICDATTCTPHSEPIDVSAAIAEGAASFKCRSPAGWHAETGGEAGSAWIRVTRGNASIEIREVVGLDHALLRPDRQPDETVGGVARDDETGEMIRTWPNTIFRGDLALEVVCRGPDRDWGSLQPVFDEVIASIEADNRT